MLQDATIVCLSSIDWDFNWQIHQEVATALARQGNRVLFVENTGVRRPGLRDASRVLHRLRNWWRAGGRAERRRDGVDVWSPMVVPLPYSRWACRLNAWLLMRVIRPWIAVTPDRPVVLLTFLPTPLAHALDERLSPGLLVYYCADRLAESSAGAVRLAPHERALFIRADIVFTTSHGLQEWASLATARSVLLAAGVRYDEFERARSAANPPAALDEMPRPIVGYVGSVRNELDLDLLVRVARRAPDLNFVFVGPLHADASALSACPNVRLLGPVSHADAVRYMLAFDAGLLPYVVNAYTRDVMPVKLKEYLAAGLPVVSTHLPEVRRFTDRHGAVVTFAHDEHAFVSALRSTIAQNAALAVDERRAVARSYDWAVQIAAMSAAMDAAVHRRTAVSTPSPS